jgi:hypothetical protein
MGIADPTPTRSQFLWLSCAECQAQCPSELWRCGERFLCGECAPPILWPSATRVTGGDGSPSTLNGRKEQP